MRSLQNMTPENQRLDLTTRITRRALDGDRDALDALVRRVTPFVELKVRQLAARGLVRGDSQDIVQQTWCVLLDRLDRIQPETGRTPARLLSYLMAALELVAKEQRSAHARRLEAPSDDTRRPEHAHPSAQLTAAEYAVMRDGKGGQPG